MSFEPAMPPAGALPTYSFGAPAAPSPRGRGKLVALLAGLVVLLGGVTGGLVIANHHGTTAAAFQSPSEANAALYAAAIESGSFHYTDTSSVSTGGVTVTANQSGDVGRNQGTQTMTSPVGDYEVIVAGSRAYMKGNAMALENMFGYGASVANVYANRWIGFTSSDGPYSAISADVTTGSTWGNPTVSPSNGMPHIPESVTGITTLNGQSVQSVVYAQSGTSRSSDTSYTGTETITFATAAPHLPVSLTERLSGTTEQQTATSTVNVAFSRWGEPVNVTVPTGAIPYSSLVGTSTTD
jgi:hypothetical protein